VRPEAFVIDEVDGTWRPVRIVPGIIRLDKDGSSAGAITACASDSHCVAAGSFQFSGLPNFRHPLSPYPFLDAEK
jgi:hypothetical protein